MKRIAVIVLGLLAVGTLLSFILVPNVVELTHRRVIKADYVAIERRLTDTAAWMDWWPQPQTYPFYDGISYKAGTRTPATIAVEASTPSISVSSFIRIRHGGHDSTGIEWVSIFPTSYNPITRISRYFEGKKIAERSAALTDHLATYFSTMENLYGVHIDEVIVRDSLLAVTSETGTNYPDLAGIYRLINKLRSHVKSNAAAETAPPMVNVSRLDGGEIVTRVAIPVDREIKSSADIQFKRMLANGNMLKTTVRGGSGEVNKALNNMRMFVEDHKRTAPAIPYQSWVTDRMANPDSSQWVTEIYYPVM